MQPITANTVVQLAADSTLTSACPFIHATRLRGCFRAARSPLQISPTGRLGEFVAVSGRRSADYRPQIELIA